MFTLQAQCAVHSELQEAAKNVSEVGASDEGLLLLSSSPASCGKMVASSTTNATTTSSSSQAPSTGSSNHLVRRNSSRHKSEHGFITVLEIGSSNNSSSKQHQHIQKSQARSSSANQAGNLFVFFGELSGQKVKFEVIWVRFWPHFELNFYQIFHNFSWKLDILKHLIELKNLLLFFYFEGLILITSWHFAFYFSTANSSTGTVTVQIKTNKSVRRSASANSGDISSRASSLSNLSSYNSSASARKRFNSLQVSTLPNPKSNKSNQRSLSQNGVSSVEEDILIYR